MTPSTGTPTATDGDAAETLKARLRADLKQAMRARASLEVGVVRALIAALDNAQAVPIGDAHQRYVVHAFGDGATEVPRLVLDAARVEGLLGDELAGRLQAADQIEGLGRAERAAELRAEAAIVARYLGR
jgi:uncharacterized protein YqeY